MGFAFLKINDVKECFQEKQIFLTILLIVVSKHSDKIYLQYQPFYLLKDIEMDSTKVQETLSKAKRDGSKVRGKLGDGTSFEGIPTYAESSDKGTTWTIEDNKRTESQKIKINDVVDITKLTLQEIQCSHCGGSGENPRGNKDRTGEIIDCYKCEGSGTVKRYLPENDDGC